MNPNIPSATQRALEALPMPRKRLEWHLRHLEHYLGHHPLPEALSPDLAIAYVSRCRLAEWQLDQVRTAIEALFRSHDRPIPAGLWQSGPTAPVPPAGPLPADPDERLLVERIRTRGMSLSTERSYLAAWRRLVTHAGRRPSVGDVQSHLTDLAAHQQVASATQRLAINAIAFAWKAVMGEQLPRLEFIRATTTRNLPTVLSRDEVKALFARVGRPRDRLILLLLYGSGLRRSECLRLRVKDIDLGNGHLAVIRGKGAKDRSVPLPQAARPLLEAQMAGVRRLWQRDTAGDWNGVSMPGSLRRKLPQAPFELSWQYVFPSRFLATDPQTGIGKLRHHLHETAVGRLVRDAARAAGITKRVTAHVLRHSFATHLLQEGKDIRTIQELMGHNKVETTMIYLHVIGRLGVGLPSPADALDLEYHPATD